MDIENMALFDMDGTLCDFEKAMFKSLEFLRGPEEEVYYPPIKDDAPKYIQNRADLVMADANWWANMPKFQFGWDVLDIARKLDYRIMILTQAPRKNPFSLSGKKMWLDKHLPGTDFTMTRDKGLIYGKVLVDDYPRYADRWLEWRKNGLVIMPANRINEGYSHKQVIRYDGSNLDEVIGAMERVRKR